MKIELERQACAVARSPNDFCVRDEFGRDQLGGSLNAKLPLAE
jgi:hypothetical protein